jgi:hypothetical protein
MTPADLDAITYLPSIRSRQAELRGYRELRPQTKRQLRPLVSVGKLGRLGQADRVLETIVETVGGECFVDINTAPGQTCDEFEGLCDPAGNYAAWRNLVGRFDRATPVALLRDNATERPFIRQVLQIENDHGVVAIRSRRPARDLASLQAALSAVDDVNNLLLILDFGYVRGSLEPKEQECLRTISALRTIDATARIAVIASSFPKAVSAYGDLRGSLELVERDLHSHIGGDQVAIYGDHSAIYPEPFVPSISRFVPRIDYCLDDAWLYERRRTDAGGYLECARQIVSSPDWDDAFAEVAWGAAVIAETVQAASVPSSFGSPANWIAARVNMHIERQHSLSSSGDAAGPAEGNDDGNEDDE